MNNHPKTPGAMVLDRKPVVHHLKINRGPFTDLERGVKTGEVRDCSDRDFQVGDFVELFLMDETGNPANRSIARTITHIQRGYGLPDDLCVLSYAPAEQTPAVGGDVPDELSEIGALINSQDNRGTDQPMFAVMEKRGMVTLDTHDHDRIEWYDPDDCCTADESKAARLEALHQGGRDIKRWERYAIKDIDVFVTACFTEKGCKDFLARDGHNHNRPFIYAFGSYRNSEYQGMRNWLKSLSNPKK